MVNKNLNSLPTDHRTAAAPRTRFRLVALSLLFLYMAFPVFAADTPGSGNADLKNYFDEILNWYKVIRNGVAIPILIVSIASTGFKFFTGGFTGNSDKALSEAIHNLIIAGAALLVLFILPAIATQVREALESSGWQPSEGSGLPSDGATTPATTSAFIYNQLRLFRF